MENPCCVIVFIRPADERIIPIPVIIFKRNVIQGCKEFIFAPTGRQNVQSRNAFFIPIIADFSGIQQKSKFSDVSHNPFLSVILSRNLVFRAC